MSTRKSVPGTWVCSSQNSPKAHPIKNKPLDVVEAGLTVRAALGAECVPEFSLKAGRSANSPRHQLAAAPSSIARSRACASIEGVSSALRSPAVAYGMVSL